MSSMRALSRAALMYSTIIGSSVSGAYLEFKTKFKEVHYKKAGRHRTYPRKAMARSSLFGVWYHAVRDDVLATPNLLPLPRVSIAPVEDELVRKARAGDAEAFGALVDRHQRAVVGFLLSVLHDPEL